MKPLAAPLTRRLLALPRPAKRWLQATYDFAVLVFSLYLAYVLRMESFSLREPLLFAVAAPTIAAVGVAVFERLGLYRALVRYGGTQQIPAVAGGVLAAAVALALMAWTRELFVPRSVPALFVVIALPLVAGTRVLLRHALLRLRRVPSPLIAIYGAGSAGCELAGALNAGNEYQAAFFVDDHPALHGSSVMGLPVFAPQLLEKLIADYEIKRLFLATPSASPQKKRQILERLLTLPIPVLTVPSVAELVSGRLSISALREVSVEDLLGREPVNPHPEWLDADIRGKVVMVSGAGGSIGSEICRLALARQPAALVLFELSELALYHIESELKNLGQTLGSTTLIHACLGSVRDESCVARVLNEYRVNTVYHAAAYKHVPLVEENLAEGILNNVFGTQTLACCAINAGVSTFVMISTDKAVRPTSAMGASKRMAELICQALAQNQTQLRFSMVRFGNVLDSSGSVVPLFRKQIRDGGPVTVTHPEVTRYFMTIREAAELVIQAGAMAAGGEVFVLDMGEPVRIAELALRMIQLSGMQARDTDHPDGDIEIIYTGLRAGEKLYEELLIGDNTSPTQHPRIQACRESFIPLDELLHALTQLKLACHQRHSEKIRGILTQLPLCYSGFHPAQ